MDEVRFSTKHNITDEGFMIHFLNNLPQEYDIVFDGLEDGLTFTGLHVPTIEMTHD